MKIRSSQMEPFFCGRGALVNFGWHLEGMKKMTRFCSPPFLVVPCFQIVANFKFQTGLRLSIELLNFLE